MPSIILTIAQARDLQQQCGAWPNGWHFLLAIEPPLLSNTLPDPERMTAGLVMLERGCTDEQIAEQLGWKSASTPLRTLARLHKQKTKTT